jgi:hypothetical protein
MNQKAKPGTIIKITGMVAIASMKEKVSPLKDSYPKEIGEGFFNSMIIEIANPM